MLNRNGESGHPCLVPDFRGNAFNFSPLRIMFAENIGKTLSDIHHSRILYDPPPRILEIKAKINKWDLIKLKSSAQQRKL